MLLGLLADSHGRAGRTARAVARLIDHGAELLIHLGDVETTAVLDELLAIPARVVFGNCDDIGPLALHARTHGLRVDHPLGRIEIDGKTIMFTHGHINPAIDEAMRARPAYFLHGHTHEIRDEKVGTTRIINPGALHRAARYTVAVLDTKTDELRVIDVSGD